MIVVESTVILPLSFLLLGLFIGVTNSHPLLPQSNLPPADGQPLQLFLVGGQSECSGFAKATDLNASNKYPELEGTIEGVWYAGYQDYYSPDHFFIAPMSADADGPKFGPELSFGERIYDVTKTRAMMVKYCIGGTNVNKHWNPETSTNDWDRREDDGTYQWLEDNANLQLDSKSHQFANMVYTIRRTEEALTSGGIPYKWAGIVWIQGTADNNQKDPYVWKTFGENTARVWNSFREEIGTDVPIVDTGGDTHNQLQSGKIYATQIVDDCLATTINYSQTAVDDTISDCATSVSNSCFGAAGQYFNQELFDFYGYDPNMPSELKTNSASKEFNWFVKYPSNMHSSYDATILKGRMLADEYLRAFTKYDQIRFERFEDNDIGLLFPFNRCPENVLPSENNICWIDYRDEELMEGPLCEGIEGPYSNNNIAIKGPVPAPSEEEMSRLDQRRGRRENRNEKRNEVRKPRRKRRRKKRNRKKQSDSSDSNSATKSPVADDEMTKKEQRRGRREKRKPSRQRRRKKRREKRNSDSNEDSQNSDDSSNSQKNKPRRRRRRRRQGD